MSTTDETVKRAYKTLVDLIPDARHFAAVVLLGDLDSWDGLIVMMGVEAAVDAIIASSEREAAPTGGLWPCTDEWVPDFRATVRGTLITRLEQYMSSKDAPIRCECGKAYEDGEPCHWTGPRSAMVRVEVMPRQHRASHEAAGNRGQYPHNGSLRLLLERSCAERLVEYDPDWARIIGDA